jgi:amino acid transporter
MREATRDRGLSRTIGTVGLTANVVNAVVGAGIFAVPAALASAAGPYAPLLLIPCALAIGAVALCFAEGGRLVATSGGPYGYVEAAFGPLWGCVSGILLLVSNLLASSSVAAALGSIVASRFPSAEQGITRAAVILCTIAGLTLVNYRQVRTATLFVSIATVTKIVPLLFFVAVGAFHVHAGNLALSAPLSAPSAGRAMILGVFALTGMEMALCASGEVARPERTIPRAVITGMLLVSLLYIAIQLVAQGMLGARLPESAAPLVDAMVQVNTSFGALLFIGAALSMFGYISSDLLGTPRLLFAFARDRLLPAALGRLHAHTHVPYVALLLYAVAITALALSGTFAELAVLATLAIAALYCATCAAVWRLVRSTEAAAKERRRITFAAAVGIVSMLALIVSAAWKEWIGLAAMVAIGPVIYRLRRQRLAVR